MKPLSKARMCGVLLLAVGMLGCGGSSRFALRAPVWQDTDNRPIPHQPPKDEESDYANTLDVMFLRPIAHAWLFEPSGESRNVNSLDEVASSTWFTNRTVTAAEVERGPCVDSGPVMPFTVLSSKVGGTTAGFVVKDARGVHYLLKLDELGEYDQPEMSTAADAIVSRLYWAVGFSTPCNHVVYVPPDDIRIGMTSIEIRETGRRLPLTDKRLREVLAPATRAVVGPDRGAYRLSASRFVDGDPAGTWRTEGKRGDDPNDVIPHQDRRELRGERFLAAWLDHWDSRGLNTFDAFVRAPGGVYIVHYFLDFSDSLGGTSTRVQWREPRVGFESTMDIPTGVADTFTLGAIRRPWDDVEVDPKFRNLGTLDVKHFDPMVFSSQTPLVRWAIAEPSDLAWMARRIARIDIEHVRAAVRTGRLTSPLEEARLVEILMGRREKILRASFAKSSPVADLAIEGRNRLCAVDLGVQTGLAKAESVSYALALKQAESAAPAPLLERSGARLCTQLPHFAPAGAADDSADRYATLDIVREEAGKKTTLRAHFYDLGASRGWVLVGIERL